MCVWGGLKQRLVHALLVQTASIDFNGSIGTFLRILTRGAANCNVGGFADYYRIRFHAVEPFTDLMCSHHHKHMNEEKKKTVYNKQTKEIQNVMFEQRISDTTLP